MKIFIALLLLVASVSLTAQTYNNSWIDYSKTYYKFKVVESKIHRIDLTTLQSAGIATSDVANFQLYRNGVQVPIFTNVVSGPMNVADYIEFYGTPNDGVQDSAYYDVKANQLANKHSLVNDTASYFLTLNTNTSQNLRITNALNNVAGNTLAADANFIYTQSIYQKTQINSGYAQVVGEHLFASTYDKGEGWASDYIRPGNPFNNTMSNLYPDFGSSVIPKYTIIASGNDINTRTVQTLINGTQVQNINLNYFEGGSYQSDFALSTLTGGTANITFNNNSYVGDDRVTIFGQQITYPRLFNFGGANNFEFTLAANALGNYLVINNFTIGSTLPLLIDITNKKRYTSFVDGSTLKFLLEPSATSRNMVLVNADASNVKMVTALQAKTFNNFMLAGNQGDYLIITSNQLHNSTASTNVVEKYKAYRASSLGGSFTVKVVDVEDLYDQYGFGINKNPTALKNYLKQARNQFAIAPKFVLIIGRGTVYTDAWYYQNEAYANQLNLVPSYGHPASDNLLTANEGTYIQTTPIGRIGAINATEVEVYLDKIKQYEAKQADPNFTIANKAWMHTASFVTGSSEAFLQGILDNYQQQYIGLWKDTSVGGNANFFTKSTINGQLPLSNTFMEKSWNTGHSIVQYFGHSSATALEFNLDDPFAYDNEGKYPFMFINGCNAGNYFVYDQNRVLANSQTLTEKFIFAPNKGSIGFIASTHFGIVNYLHYYNQAFFKNVSSVDYGKPIGVILKNASTDMLALTGTTDFYSKMHAEQILLQGDPALKLNVAYPKPDYVVEPQTITITPKNITVADSTFNVKLMYMNLAKATNDSINITVKREFPNGTIVTLYNKKVRAAKYADSINFKCFINPIKDIGINRVIIKVDANNVIDEMSETNNEASKTFEIFENGILPIYPYNYAIVNATPVTLSASTANPLAIQRNYIMELDTTELFNSPLKTNQTVLQTGGVVQFAPTTALLNNKVYYWRVKPVGAALDVWQTFSFTYIAGSTEGFNQGHLYQHLKSTYSQLSLDSSSRKYKFDPVSENISVRNGVWPTGSYEESHATVSVNQDAYIRGICLINHIMFNVFDPINGKPWQNNAIGVAGQYNSDPTCYPGREWNYSFNINNAASRKNAMDFIDSIPTGSYVVIRNTSMMPWWLGTAQDEYINTWKNDTTINGTNKSLYHSLYNLGCTKIDSFTTDRAYIFVLRKGMNSTFAPKQVVSDGIYDRISVATDFVVSDTVGFISSPPFGPAKEWKEVHWDGSKLENNGDKPKVYVYGIRPNGTEQQLFELDTLHKDFNIASVSAIQYPYIKLKMTNEDGKNGTPYQLDYWRLNYTPVPEGAVAPNLTFNLKDSFDFNENIAFNLAFKNVSNANFDSIAVKVNLVDAANTITTISLPKQKILLINDTLQINESFASTGLASGDYEMYIDVNPDNSQPEQYHFNNMLYKKIYLRAINLPVNWVKVSAQLINNSQTKVSWTTANESNTDKFILEHSVTGSNFAPIGQVAAAGNSTYNIDYTYNHLQPADGVNYYRIKQVDKNGVFKYSIIVTVFKTNKTGSTIIAPNPVKNVLQIIEPTAKQINTVDIYTTTGIKIMHFAFNEKSNYFRLPVATLASGTYVVQIHYNNTITNTKFIKE